MKPDDLLSADQYSLDYHRLIESMKFAYAARTHLADPAFALGATEVQAQTAVVTFG